MKSIQRLLITVWILATGAALAAPPVGITVDAARPGPVINKNVYGQFTAQAFRDDLGGLWVGPQSKIANLRGWRKDVLGALKDLHVPLLRWPGGCFADKYHWRDGIGPRNKRPVTGGGDGENSEVVNAIGTHEFFDLVELLGAAAYVTGNVGTGTPREAADWVEYMTAESDSTLAQLRARNGHSKPFKLAFFGIGNESRGCGGAMLPEYYADLYNQYAVFIKGRGGSMPELIASGGDAEWIDALSEKRRIRDYRNAISLHDDAIANADRGKPGATIGFGEEQWIAAMKAALQLARVIDRNVATLQANAPQNMLSLVVDESGTLYAPAPDGNPHVQQTSLRDAVVAALHFHILHAHAERVSMANVAPMANVRKAKILTDGDRMVLTPTYYAFQMYVPFQNATSLPVRLDNNPQYTFGTTTVPAISASAARGKDGKLYLALVNTDPGQALDVAVEVVGAKAGTAFGTVLTSAAMDAHNTFAAPQTIVPAPFQASIEHGRLVAKLPAKSIAVLALTE